VVRCARPAGSCIGGGLILGQQDGEARMESNRRFEKRRLSLALRKRARREVRR